MQLQLEDIETKLLDAMDKLVDQEYTLEGLSEEQKDIIAHQTLQLHEQRQLMAQIQQSILNNQAAEKQIIDLLKASTDNDKIFDELQVRYFQFYR